MAKSNANWRIVSLALVFSCFVAISIANAQPPPSEAPTSMDQALPPSGQVPPSSGQVPHPSGQVPPSNGQVPHPRGQAPPGQAQPSSGQAPPSSGQAPPSSGHVPPSNGQAQPSNGQAPPSNGQAPPSNGQVPHPGRQAPPSNGQVPHPGRQAPPSSHEELQPTHQDFPPAGQRMPPPHRGGPPPRRGPPPPPRIPSFLIPSAESSDAFDGTESSFVYVLPSRRRQCFHHRTTRSFRFEYRVLHGGRLDIDVYIVGPGGSVAYESRERRHGGFVAPAAPDSLVASIEQNKASPPVHTVCLDNRHSSWYDKIVDFRIELVRQQLNGSEALEPLPEAMAEELKRLDISWSRFQSLTWAVHDNLHRSASIQREFRGDEKQDRLAMEDSAGRVSRWSAFQLAVMLSVSGLQVLMIRSLFDEKSVLHRLWRVRGF